MSPQARGREGGFTLVELLIAMAISGIVMTAAATGFISVARGTKDLHDRFLQSHDAQLLATYLPADVQSADPNLVPETTPTEAAGWAVCAGTAPAGTTNVLQLRWSESSGAGTTNFAAGYRTQLSGTDWQLVRYFCADSTPAVLETHIVARHLADQTDPAKRPVVNTSVPREITMKVFAFSSDIGDFDYTFRGRMRTPLPAIPGPEVLSITRVGATPTTAASVQWVVTFDGAVTGVDATDFDLDGISDAGITGVTPSPPPAGGTTTYTVTAGTGTVSGALRLDLVDDNTIKDAAGAALGGTVLGDGNFSSGETYDVDRDDPSAISITPSSLSGATGSPVSWTVTFDEDVTGVSSDGSDFSVSVVSGTTTTGVLTVAPVDASTYTVTTTPSGAGTIRLDLIDNDTISDLVGNGLPAGFTGEPYDVTAGPSGPTIQDVVLTNSGTSGQINKGDSVTITFSEAMAVNTFCTGATGWSGDTSDQSITANNAVTVTITDGGVGNDILTVTSTSCTQSNFGSVDLGSPGWVTANRTAGGGGTNKSTITWDASSHQLMITLGTISGATPTGVGSSRPVYATDADARGSTGGSITNSPKTAPGLSGF